MKIILSRFSREAIDERESFQVCYLFETSINFLKKAGLLKLYRVSVRSLQVVKFNCITNYTKIYSSDKL